MSRWNFTDEYSNESSEDLVDEDDIKTQQTWIDSLK